MSRELLGLCGTPTHNSWSTMKQRCLNPTNSNYHYYGGRGITVDPKWLLLSGFVADMGLRPPGGTLERIDNSKGYYKDNCKWATRREQSNNMRRNHLLTVADRTLTLMQWSRETGINFKTLDNRIKLGWEPEHIVSIPAYRGPKYKTRVAELGKVLQGEGTTAREENTT